MAKQYMDWDDLVTYHNSLKEIIPTITINETRNVVATFYAPTAKGATNQVLRWPSSGTTPVWSNERSYAGNAPIKIEGSTVSHLSGAGNMHIPAGGAAGNYLKWSASGAAVWDNTPVTSVMLNGTNSSAPVFWAPTTAGTAGYFLKSNGSGSPTWESLSGMMSYKGSKNTVSEIYAITGASTGDCWNAKDTGKNFAFNGGVSATKADNWDDLGGTVDLSTYVSFADKATTAAFGVVKIGANLASSNGVVDIQSIPLTGASSIASLFA